MSNELIYPREVVVPYLIDNNVNSVQLAVYKRGVRIIYPLRSITAVSPQELNDTYTELRNNLQPNTEIGFCSEALIYESQNVTAYHIPIIDLSTVSLDSTCQYVDEFLSQRKVRDLLGRDTFEVHIVNSGASFHLYFFNLVSKNALMEIFSAAYLPVRSWRRIAAIPEDVDRNYLLSRFVDRCGFLRWSNNTKPYEFEPHVVKSFRV
jgi:hypothetical protein